MAGEFWWVFCGGQDPCHVCWQAYDISLQEGHFKGELNPFSSYSLSLGANFLPASPSSSLFFFLSSPLSSSFPFFPLIPSSLRAGVAVVLRTLPGPLPSPTHSSLPWPWVKLYSTWFISHRIPEPSSALGAQLRKTADFLKGYKPRSVQCGAAKLADSA